MRLVSREKRDINIPSSSLADIAFLLIIFFMVATLFNTAKGLRFDLPAKKSKPKQIKRNQVVIVQLNKSGKLTVDGSPVKEAELERVIRERKQDDASRALLFRVKRGAAYGRFTRVVSRLREAGYQRFAIKGVD